MTRSVSDYYDELFTDVAPVVSLILAASVATAIAEIREKHNNSYATVPEPLKEFLERQEELAEQLFEELGIN